MSTLPGFRALAALRPTSGDVRDPLLERSGPDVCWTRINVAEAAPGVLTPLAWSGFYRGPSEIAVMTGFADLGVMPSRTARHRHHDQRLLGCFYGRLSINVSTLRSIMGGLPGTSGDDVERDILGSSRSGLTDESFGWRVPALAARMPRHFVTNTGELDTLRRDIERWWRRHLGPDGVRDGHDPQRVFEDALDWFCAAMRLHGRARLFCQATQSQVATLAADDPALTGQLLAGCGDMEETAVADGIWKLARNQLTMDQFQSRFGFHGPDVGNVASHSWRENPAPVERLLDRYAQLADEQRPAKRAAGVVEQRRRAQTRLLAGLRGPRRITADLLLRSAPRFVRDLQRGKAAYLIALDAARGAARSYGRILAERRVLADPEDIFHLTAEEILEPLAGDVAELIAYRRQRHEHYRTLICPETWIGAPTATTAVTDRGERRGEISGLEISGLGVSGGVVEGTARIVLDPADAGPIEDDDILVCPVTDPSWVSYMAICAGLVIDIGSSASHGALIARELGIPCVINTSTGTRDLRTGDRIRINGDSGAVQILSQHPPAAPAGAPG